MSVFARLQPGVEKSRSNGHVQDHYGLSDQSVCVGERAVGVERVVCGHFVDPLVYKGVCIPRLSELLNSCMLFSILYQVPV
jgi:hypothetical protein